LSREACLSRHALKEVVMRDCNTSRLVVGGGLEGLNMRHEPVFVPFKVAEMPQHTATVQYRRRTGVRPYKGSVQ
jgi:hypothetical protein